MPILLHHIRGFVFDMDGTLIAGRQVLPGALELVEALRTAGLRIVVLSNSSQMLSHNLARHLTELGIPIEGSESLTSLDLLGLTIHQRLGATKILVLGNAVMVRELEEAGHTVVAFEQWEDANAVAVGNDLQFDYARLRTASRVAARHGKLFTCNLDGRMPVEDGQFDPGCGALTEAIAVASGVQPIVIGKPHQPLFQRALERLGCQASETAIVGDTVASDIAGGRAAGMVTIWINPSGKPHHSLQADVVVRSLVELHELWTRTHLN